MSHLEQYLDRVTQGDCIDAMQSLPDECVDLVIADPPYNLDKDFGPWKERDHREDWLLWSKRWLNECKRVLKWGGSIFVHGIHHHLCWLQCHLYEIGMSYRRQIIWHYENGFSGYRNTLAAHYEPILWFSKGDEYTYHEIREPYKSAERLRHRVTKNGRVWTPNPAGRMAGDVWQFPTLAGRRFAEERLDHPTQKPLALAMRMVEHFSNRGEIVLVPFAGSGTECEASFRLERRFVGFELNQEYTNMARDRLAGAGCTMRLVTDLA